MAERYHLKVIYKAFAHCYILQQLSWQSTRLLTEWSQVQVLSGEPLYAALAELVRQLTCNQQIPGSSPGGGTIFYGVALVSTGAIKYYNTSRRYALNPKIKLNGNILKQFANKVKSLFTTNVVAFAQSRAQATFI